MLALNRTTIDFFSLDVEGAEPQIVKTINFNKLNIRTITLEYKHVKGGQEGLMSLITSQGMKLHKNIINRDGVYAKDLFFIQNNMTPIPGRSTPAQAAGDDAGKRRHPNEYE